MPIDYLLSRQNRFEEHLRSESSNYAPVNLLWGQGVELSYWSNQGRGIARLTPGVHGLSNGFLNEEWPKVERGKQHLSRLITDDSVSVEGLLDLLDDTTPAPEAELPHTGLPPELEKALSSIRIKIRKGYGSRTATVVLCNRSGEYRIAEKNYQTQEVVEFVVDKL